MRKYNSKIDPTKFLRIAVLLKSDGKKLNCFSFAKQIGVATSTFTRHLERHPDAEIAYHEAIILAIKALQDWDKERKGQ